MNNRIQDYGLKEEIEKRKDNLDYLQGVEKTLNCISLMFWSGKNGSVELFSTQYDNLKDLEELIRKLKNEILKPGENQNE